MALPGHGGSQKPFRRRFKLPKLLPKLTRRKNPVDYVELLQKLSHLVVAVKTKMAVRQKNGISAERVKMAQGGAVCAVASAPAMMAASAADWPQASKMVSSGLGVSGSCSSVSRIGCSRDGSAGSR